MRMIQLFFVAFAAVFFETADLATAQTSNDADERILHFKQEFIQKKTLTLDHVRRVDRSRLRTIDIGLDRLTDKIESDTPTTALLDGLVSVEASLYALRLDPEAVKARIARVACLRAALQSGQRHATCSDDRIAVRSAEVLADPSINEFGIARLAAARPSAATLPDSNGRATFMIGIYGPSVDYEVGRFFGALAVRDAKLLRPIPIDREYQLNSCLSGAVSGLVSKAARAAEPAFIEMLETASDLVKSGDDVWRFTLLERDLDELTERAGVTAPARLADFDVSDASRLITNDFAVRHGLLDTERDQLAALRNLWIAQDDARFLQIISGATATRVNIAGEVGPALTRAGINGDSVWPVVYDAALRVLHCRDANKVFEAYGLVYKNGDYPSARQVLRTLEEELGYPAVPGVSISQTDYVFLEANPQNCSAFGPVEQLAGGTSREECNLRQISVDGQDRWEVRAGGVQIQFFADSDERREILAAMRDVENLPRDGDILRWRSSSRVPVESQATKVMLLPRGGETFESELPCVVSLSKVGSFTGKEELLGHVRNYRKYFYPKGDLTSPKDLSIVFVLDEFEGYLDDAFYRKWQETIHSFTMSYRNVVSLTEHTEAQSQAVGQTHLPETVILPVCSALADQIREISSERDVSHGAFVKSLLVGSGTPLAAGVGILNSKGDFAEEDFENRLHFWATEGDLSLLVENMVEARELFPPDADEVRGPTIFNLSLGSSYRFADKEETRNARKLIGEMKVVMARWNDALFVVAAGQPDGNPERGENLKRVSAKSVDVDDPDCSFFPACLSTRSNVITVGAVQPSASRLGHKRPVLIPWSNYGSAVSVAAPGAGVMSREFGFIESDNNSIRALPITTVRDGTSVATVFVTALAARIAAQYPEISAPEIKRRLISTALHYSKPGEDGGAVLFEGGAGELYAGVIDPTAALLDPNKYHVRWKTPHPDSPEIEEFKTLLPPKEIKPFAIFSSERQRGHAELKCRWADIYRIHIDNDIGEEGAPLFTGGVACKNEVRGELIEVGFGPLGTKRSRKQHPCLFDGVCFKGLTKDDKLVPIDFADVRDIYFPVVGR